MDSLKTLNLLAAGMSEEEIIKVLKKSIDEWEKDPTSKNLSKISINAMLLNFKEMQTKVGNNPFEGFMKMNGDLDEAKKLSNMMERMSGDHLDKSKN